MARGSRVCSPCSAPSKGRSGELAWCGAHACVLRAVHRVRRARRHRWRWAQVTFWCPEEQLYHLWLQTLRELLETLSTCLLCAQRKSGCSETL